MCTSLNVYFLDAFVEVLSVLFSLLQFLGSWLFFELFLLAAFACLFWPLWLVGNHLVGCLIVFGFLPCPLRLLYE